MDVNDLNGLAAAMGAALDIDGPAVVSVECAADEIPPFAPFLTATAAKRTAVDEISIAKENHTNVAASA
jgi:acetolactate synthase I/II/III large subunit